MSLANDIDLFRRIPLLAEFTDEQLRLLAFGAEDRQVAAGTVLFEAGDRADSSYVVASGRVELRSADDSRLLATIAPGALIGETALLTETTRQTRAVVGADASVVQIRRSLFRRILSEFPDLSRRLYDSRARRLSGTLAELNRIRDALQATDPQSDRPADS